MATPPPVSLASACFSAVADGVTIAAAALIVDLRRFVGTGVDSGEAVAVIGSGIESLELRRLLDLFSAAAKGVTGHVVGSRLLEDRRVDGAMMRMDRAGEEKAKDCKLYGRVRREQISSRRIVGRDTCM